MIWGHYGVVDLGDWRKMQCLLCLNVTEFYNPSPRRMDMFVAAHECAAPGWPWGFGLVRAVAFNAQH